MSHRAGGGFKPFSVLRGCEVNLKQGTNPMVSVSRGASLYGSKVLRMLL